VVLTWFIVFHTRPTQPPPSTPEIQNSSPSQRSRDPASLSANVCTDIYQVVCQKKGVTHDPTGFVRPDIEGEREAIQIYRQIIHENPDWSSEQVDEELANRIFEPKRRSRIESAFKWVRQTLKAIIDRQPLTVFSISEKRIIKNRIKHTQLQLPIPASLYSDEPDLLKKNEVYYERLAGGNIRLRVGGAYVLIARSWFNLIFTLAHELAHAIDPCELQSAGHVTPAAYQRLSRCFIQTGLISEKSFSDCRKSDRLSETFADWIASQVSLEALKIFSTEFHPTQVISAVRNSVRDLCEQEEEGDDLDTEIHPPPKMRINQIFGPAIGSFLGCPTTQTLPQYCTFETANPGAQSL
jgi:hypothetical protein